MCLYVVAQALGRHPLGVLVRKFFTIGLIVAILLYVLYCLFGTSTYTWTEPLSTGDKTHGVAHRELTFSSGAPELQTLVLELNALPLPLRWRGTTDVTPRAVAFTGADVYLVATPWLARGRPDRDVTCAHLFKYHEASTSWVQLPRTDELPMTELMLLASPTTFLRFGFPSRLSMSKALRPQFTSSGKIKFHSFDISTAPSLQIINNNRCN